MDFASFLPFVPVIPCSFSAFRGGLDGATIKNGCRRLFLLPFGQSQQDSQVMYHIFEYTCCNPALRLLIHGVPRWKIIRHHPPLSTCANDPSQTIEHLS